MQNTQSISQLGELIKNTLENELEPTYWVIGEVADFRQAPQGHAYFELVEKQGNQVLAKIRCNCWQFTFRSIASRFETLTGSGLKNGMKVLAQVQVTFHSVYGLSLNIKDIDPSFSLGERARIRQETIDRLTKEGLLRLNAGRTFPQVIQKIAIVSSPTAAGYGDFINQLENNTEGYKVYHRLFPSLMQGNEAVSSLVQAIELVESKKEILGLEALIIIRGGGAQLDLDCFDDYRLAAKIAQCSLPVFTGIGHERDETVADLVAHTRLKTPTAVAEFLLSGFRIFEETLALGLNRLDRSTSQLLKLEESKLLQISHGLKSSSLSQVLLEKEKIKAKQGRLELASKRQIMGQTESLEQLEKALKKETILLLTQENQKLGNMEKLLNQLKPESIMKRGYSRSEINGIPVQFSDPKVGDEMLTFSQDQKIKSTITQIEKQ